MNERIRAKEVRVVGPDGKILGVYPTLQAVQMAGDFGLDLIEVAPNAKPPTCKIMDYGKWKYETKKKAQASKKKQVVVSIKEIQIRPRTDSHDLEVKLKHARRFLLDGDKVKVNMRFHGREMAHQETGRALLNRVAEDLQRLGNLETAPKQEGRQLFLIVAPDNTKIKDFKKSEARKAEVSTAEEAAASQETQDTADVAE